MFRDPIRGYGSIGNPASAARTTTEHTTTFHLLSSPPTSTTSPRVHTAHHHSSPRHWHSPILIVDNHHFVPHTSDIPTSANSAERAPSVHRPRHLTILSIRIHLPNQSWNLPYVYPLYCLPLRSTNANGPCLYIVATSPSRALCAKFSVWAFFGTSDPSPASLLLHPLLLLHRCLEAPALPKTSKSTAVPAPDLTKLLPFLAVVASVGTMNPCKIDAPPFILWMTAS